MPTSSSYRAMLIYQNLSKTKLVEYSGLNMAYIQYIPLLFLLFFYAQPRSFNKQGRIISRTVEWPTHFKHLVSKKYHVYIINNDTVLINKVMLHCAKKWDCKGANSSDPSSASSCTNNVQYIAHSTSLKVLGGTCNCSQMLQAECETCFNATGLFNLLSHCSVFLLFSSCWC